MIRFVITGPCNVVAEVETPSEAAEFLRLLGFKSTENVQPVVVEGDRWSPRLAVTLMRRISPKAKAVVRLIRSAFPNGVSAEEIKDTAKLMGLQAVGPVVGACNRQAENLGMPAPLIVEGDSYKKLVRMREEFARALDAAGES